MRSADLECVCWSLTVVCAWCASGVRNRTDYVDTTGESPWVLDMIRAHDGTARANGVCIVPTCGFDSIPSDLGCFMVVDYMRTKLRQGVADVKAGFSVGGSASGGTLHTMMGLIDSGRARDMANPRHLCVPPTDVDDAPDPRAIVGPVRNTVLAWDADFKKWQIPFLMAGVNNAVVRRSAYLAAVAGTPYTRPTTDAAAASDEVDSVPFTYNETMSRSGFLRAFFIAGMMGVGVLLAMVSVCRRLAARFVLPAPGTGPSPAVRSRSFFRTKFVATSVGAAPVKVIGEVSGGDPGYDETAKMVAEAGLCLAENRDELPGRGGGILTPASAFGHTLIRRLTKANMQFTVHEAGAPSKL